MFSTFSTLSSEQDRQPGVDPRQDDLPHTIIDSLRNYLTAVQSRFKSKNPFDLTTVGIHVDKSIYFVERVTYYKTIREGTEICRTSKK